MTHIKICGVTLPDDAARVAAAGVEYIGLNFWSKSKRYLEPERAPLIAAAARASGTIQVVGVFVDPDPEDIRAVTSQVALDVIQLHGDEDPEDVEAIALATNAAVWKAIAVGTADDLDNLERWSVEHILLDTPSAGKGGSGQTFDWAHAAEAHRRYPARQFVLAGGLAADNVGAAIAAVAPWGVDVASGVEAAPGIKDAEKLAAFVAAVRAAG